MTFELCPECGLETPYDDDGDEVVENLCPDCAAALTTLDSGEIEFTAAPNEQQLDFESDAA